MIQKTPDNLLYSITLSGTINNSYKWHYSPTMYWCCPQDHIRYWEYDGKTGMASALTRQHRECEGYVYAGVG